MRVLQVFHYVPEQAERMSLSNPVSRGVHISLQLGGLARVRDMFSGIQCVGSVASADESVLSAALVVKRLGRRRTGSSLSTARAQKTAAALSDVFLHQAPVINCQIIGRAEK